MCDEDSDEDGLDECLEQKFEHIQRTRYATRSSHYLKRKKCWHKLLYNREHTSDADFLKDFRMKRSAFFGS
ncbi:hypothetical protein L914_08866, partial [Phytophthora nicotianae]